MRKINTLYVITSLECGGAERRLVEFLKKINRDRYYPIVCCLFKGGFFLREVEKEKIKVYILNKHKFDFTIFFSLLKIIKKEKIEIIHTHMFISNFWGRLAGKFAKVPVIISTEHCTVIPWKNWFQRLMDKILSRWSDMIIAVSESVKMTHLSREKIFPDKMVVIYDGVDTDKFNSELVDRESEIREITQLLRIGQNIILVAPRKYGKTSLILEILNRMRLEGYFTGMVDLFGILTKRQLSEKIVDTVLLNKRIKHSIKLIKENIVKAMKMVELKQTIQDFEFIVGFSNYQIDEDSLFDSSLDFPEEFAKKHKKHLILAFDEFGDIFKLNGEPMMKKLRSKFQLHKNVTYIFSGSQESLMKELFTESKSAFFRFGRVFHLAELPRNDFREYIIKSFEKEKINITYPIAEEILDRTNCHPYYTQLLSQLCWLEAKGRKSKISIKDVKLAH